MFFLSGAASSVLDYLTSAQSSSQPTPPAGATDATQGLFDIATSMGTGASGTTGSADSSGSTEQNSGSSNVSGAAPWWSTPGTMNTLLAAQGQSATGTGATDAFSQLFATLEGSASGGSTDGGSTGDLGGVENWGANTGSASNLFSSPGTSGAGIGGIAGFSQLFATLESGAGLAQSSFDGATSGIEGLAGAGSGSSQAQTSGTSGAGEADSSGTSQGGTTTQTVTNADGSTTTIKTYADGSTVTTTTPASGSTASATGETNFGSTLLARLLQAQSQIFAAPGQSLSALV